MIALNDNGNQKTAAITSMLFYFITMQQVIGLDRSLMSYIFTNITFKSGHVHIIAEENPHRSETSALTDQLRATVTKQLMPMPQPRFELTTVPVSGITPMTSESATDTIRFSDRPCGE